LDLIGLTNSIIEAAIIIDSGRKGFAIIGEERAGRISYEKGIVTALNCFRDAQISTDPQTIILAEYTFLSQELHLCSENDKETINSLTNALQSFDDAFSALNVVEKSNFYQEAEKTYPHNSKFRINGFPKDAFHIACISHKTRLKNILSATGVDPIEKSLLKQRHSNLSTAQNSYAKKQKIALIEKPP
jgi:hypothetical protein